MREVRSPFEPAGSESRPAHGRILLVLAAAAPGALAGTFLAGLLFFLNPLWPFAAEPVARAVARYATPFALVSLLLVLPFTWRRPARSGRIVPWALVAVFSVAGVLAWVHAARFSLYLPPGINQRLIKAALWLSLAGVAAFYTVLVHVVRRRRPGPRTHLWLALLALLSVYSVLERREAFDPPVPLPPRPSSLETAERPSLLVVGLSGATLDVVLPLAEQGQLPFLAELMRTGSYGRLRSLEPTRRAPAWTSLATGKLPFRHGVLDDRVYAADFVERGQAFRLLPVGIGFEHWGVDGGALPPRADLASLSLPVWRILDRLGLDVRVHGWPGAATGGFPEATTSSLAASGLDSDLEVLTAAGRWLSGEGLPSTRPRFAFVFLGGLEQVSLETFGGFSAVQFDGRQHPASVAAARELTRAYARVDEALSRTWRSLPEPKLIAVVSAHGVRTLGPVARLTSLAPRASALGGRTSGAPDGVLLLRGPGISGGRFLSRVTALDVVPTLLYGIGFPAALDFDGRILTEAFAPEHLGRQPLSFIPSYETTRRIPG